MWRALLVAAGALAACTDNRTPLPSTDVAPPLACLPDLDGALTAAELPVALDAAAPFYVARGPRAVDLAGADVDGTRVWDLSAESADDDLVELGPAPLAGRWYAADLAGGAFVVDAGSGLDGVYHLDDLGLWLHGLASREPDPPGGRTLLVYDAPVPVLRLPLAAGDAWTATATVTGGTLNGLPYNGADTYEIDAQASGRLDVPYVRFEPALKVRTRVVVAPAAGGVTTSRRQTSYLVECFGEVARAESAADEPAPDFTTAAALRRFAL